MNKAAQDSMTHECPNLRVATADYHAEYSGRHACQKYEKAARDIRCPEQTLVPLISGAPINALALLLAESTHAIVKNN